MLDEYHYHIPQPIDITKECKLDSALAHFEDLYSKDSITILHFGFLEGFDSFLDKYQLEAIKTSFFHVFLGHNFINQNVWIKRILNTDMQLLKYSWRELIQSNSTANHLICKEITDQNQIENMIKTSISELEEYVILNITRWTITVGNTQIFIDSSRPIQYPDNYYTVCSCKSNDPREILPTLQTLGFSVLYPVRSKIMEFLTTSPDALEIQCDLFNQFENGFSFDEYRSLFHRFGNPLDYSKKLPHSASAEEVQHWCRNLYENKLFPQIGEIAIQFNNARALYDANIEELLDSAIETKHDEIYAVVLYFNLRLFDAPMRYTRKQLIDLVKKDPSKIVSLRREEINALLDNDVEQCGFEESVMDELYDQCNFLIQVQNDFFQFIAKEDLPFHYVA